MSEKPKLALTKGVPKREDVAAVYLHITGKKMPEVELNEAMKKIEGKIGK